MNTELRTIASFDWMTIILLAALLIFTFGKYLYQSRFLSFVVLPFNNKYLFLYNKKGKLLNWFHIFLTLFQLLNCSLFIFLAHNILKGTEQGHEPTIFLLILALMLLFLLVKIMLQLTKGFVFNTYKLVTELIYTKLSYFNHSAIVLFIANIVLIYILNDSKPVVFIAILLILIINGIGLGNLLKNRQKLILGHVFYFILYLCALEIAPLVIIGSYLKG